MSTASVGNLLRIDDVGMTANSPSHNESDSPPLPRRAIALDETEEAAPTVLCYADVVMDLVALRVSRAGKYVQLRPTEFRLLRLLIERPERAFTRDQLINGVWGYGVKLDPRSINTYLGRLRRALSAGGHKNLIRTITRYGYSLDANCAD